MMAAADAPSSLAPLRRGAFRALFIAQFISNIGTWMQSVGAQWFLVDRAHSPALVAWIQTAETLPVLLLSLLAGMSADLLNRRRLLLTTSLVSAGVAAALTVVTFMGVLGPWPLLGFTFLLGCSAAITGPAWQAIQPELVPREELPQASALGSVTINAARAVGPAVAGIIVAASGPGIVFALNTVSFLVVTLTVLAWRRPPQEEPDVRERILSGLVSGIRYVRSAPGVRRILLRCVLFAFPASALWALLPSAAKELMSSGAGGYSALLACLGIGAIIGTLIIGTIRRMFSGSVALAASAVVFGLGTAAAAWLPLWAALATCVLSGVAWVSTLTTLNVAMQMTLPNWVRARGLSVYLLSFMGSQAIGSFLWGLIAEGFGVRESLTVAAVLLLLVAVSVVVLPLYPEIGTLDSSIVPLASSLPSIEWDHSGDAPAIVRVSYTVPAENVDAFRAAMRHVRLSRRRTGAMRWWLMRQTDSPQTFVEEFVVPSWDEHTLQHTNRWTGYDAEVYQRARDLTDSEPYVEHLLATDTLLSIRQPESDQ
jgi:MFS family permease